MRTLLACAALTACLFQAPASQETKTPGSVFKELDGKWKGTFVGWDETGHELYRIRVEQTYRTISKTEQLVRIRDQMPDGTVIKGEGKNVARHGKRGELILTCRVDKSTGDKVEHKGRVTKGPTGRKEIVWFSSDKDRSETFREWVEKRGKDRWYHIQGMGRYGKTRILMAGSYKKQR